MSDKSLGKSIESLQMVYEEIKDQKWGKIKICDRAALQISCTLDRLKKLQSHYKARQLTKDEFHHILSEFPPSIAHDSGQPEWTTGEIDKVWDFITGKCKFIEYDRRERKARRLSEAELHEIWYKNTGIEISLTINKGLKAIFKAQGKDKN